MLTQQNITRREAKVNKMEDLHQIVTDNPLFTFALSFTHPALGLRVHLSFFFQDLYLSLCLLNHGVFGHVLTRTRLGLLSNTRSVQNGVSFAPRNRFERHRVTFAIQDQPFVVPEQLVLLRCFVGFFLVSKELSLLAFCIDLSIQLVKIVINFFTSLVHFKRV